MYRRVFWTAVVLLIFAYPSTAATYYVGSCKSGSFPTISAAISSSLVAPGSTIAICPGQYKEQVFISKPVTLQGLTAHHSSQVQIFYDTPETTVSRILGTALAPIVWVTASPVNIRNIVVSDFYSTTCPSPEHVGIFYDSGASGNLNHVAVQTVFGNNIYCTGYGIWAENANVSPTSVNISNSFSDAGIVALSANISPVLTVNITGNQIFPSASNTVLTSGIYLYQVKAGVTSISIIVKLPKQRGGLGVYASAKAVTISGNTILGEDLDTGGIAVVVDGPSILSNTFVGLGNGISLNCTNATVSSNTFTSSGLGIAAVPSSFTGTNNFYTDGLNTSASCGP